MDSPDRSSTLSRSPYTMAASEPDIVCLSHLRWDCATTRPRPRATVYDCTDERPAGDDDHELLRRADLVFTGDPDVYATHDARHTGVHLLGVDDPARAWARMQHLLNAAERIASATTWRLDPAVHASA